MKKMRVFGKVVAIEGGEASVRLEPHESCGGRFRCACCTSFRPGPRTIRVNPEGLEIGDTVQVSMPAHGGYLSAFVLFVLPPVLFVAGILVGGAVADQGGADDLSIILGGVCGFGLAVAIALLVNRILNRPGRFEVQHVKQGEV